MSHFRPVVSRRLPSAFRPTLSNAHRSLHQQEQPAHSPSPSSTPSLSSNFSSSSSSTASTSSSSAPPSRTSVNASEVAFFSKLSSQWWDESGELGLLHKMNPPRLAFLREKMRESALRDGEEDGLSFGVGGFASVGEEGAGGGGNWLEGKRVLDVGCGGGLLSESLARLGASTLGIDATPSNIPLAQTHQLLDPFLTSPPPQSHQQYPRLEYRHQTAEDLLKEEGEGQFDVVCAMEVLEHVDDPKGFLMDLTKLVKPGGHLVLSTISRTPLAHLLTITFAESLLRLVSPGTHTSSKFVKPSELDEFFDSLSPTPWNDSRIPGYNGGGGVRESRGILYVPWKGKWELVGRNVGDVGRAVNYLYYVRKPKQI